MKRILCILLGISLLLGTVSFAWAEEDGEDDIEYSAEELAEMEAEEKEAEDDVAAVVTGEVYHEKTREDFDLNSPALYTARMRTDFGGSIYAVKWASKEDIRPQDKLLECKGAKLDILYVGLRWLIVRKDKTIGYIKREYVNQSEITPVDPVNTPPLNVQKHSYIAKTAMTCHVRKSMTPSQGAGDDGNNWVILKPGTELSIWKFYKGWAVVNYMREYGYIDPNELTDLVPVSPTDEELFPDSPIAAYTSYYKMTQTETNLNRIHNIKTGCGYITDPQHQDRLRLYLPGASARRAVQRQQDHGALPAEPGIQGSGRAHPGQDQAGLRRRHLPGVQYAVQRVDPAAGHRD